jgi:hypothetical protein
MCWRALCWTFLLIHLLMPAARAQNLHLISAADINVVDIGEWVAVNHERVQATAKQIAEAAGLNLKFTEVTTPSKNNETIACAPITKAVADLQAGPDDVILFYYSGHGFRPDHERDNPEKFPWLICDELVPVEKTPNLSEINTTLMKKGARLTITVADACNKSLTEEAGAPRIAAPAPDRDRIRTMFRQFRGNLVMSGSKRGQLSYYWVDGGLFTIQFVKHLVNPPSTAPAKLWDETIERATKAIMVQRPTGPPEQQDPQAVAALAYLPN